MKKKDAVVMDKALFELMVITMEECGELTQACSKILRKYSTKEAIEDKYSTQLLEEAGDVLCMIELLQEHGVLNTSDLYARVNDKQEKLRLWSSLICGATV